MSATTETDTTHDGAPRVVGGSAAPTPDSNKRTYFYAILGAVVLALGIAAAAFLTEEAGDPTGPHVFHPETRD